MSMILLIIIIIIFINFFNFLNSIFIFYLKANLITNNFYIKTIFSVFLGVRGVGIKLFYANKPLLRFFSTIFLDAMK